jgi:non-ribosomal peptide synthase protein (TIGR01720 family)/FkbM family methyltransferase
MKTAEFTFYPRASATSGMYADRKADEEMTRAYMNNQGEVSNYTEDFLEGRFETERYSCQLMTISDIIRENLIDQVDLLKVDVEKSELDVLNGIEDDDWKRIKQIVIEVHDSDGRLEAITLLLEEHGFDFLVEQDKFGKNTGLYNIYAIHPTRRPALPTTEQELFVEKLNPLVSVKDLRSALAQRLPEYMVPAAFALLEELPRLPNGKVDRASLPAPDRVQLPSRAVYTAPSTVVEETLTGIWKQVLGLEQIGIHDNFFELGGDSILSIQIIARAHQAGLKLSPKLIFRHQTIAELSQVAVSSAASTTAWQGLATGEIPLTPIQHSFFEQDVAEQHHFNQSVLLEVKRPLRAERLQQVVEQLSLHHDALRLRFRRDDVSGEWRQYYAGEEAAQQVRVAEIDLSEVTVAEREAVLEAKAIELQSGLNLQDGPLMRVALIEMGSNQGQRLLLVIHHLAVDGVSWRILLDDLERGIDQVDRGEAISWGQKTTSYGQWSERLAGYAQGVELREELAFWSEVERAVSSLPLPLDYKGEERTLSSSRTILQELETDETRALLQEVPAAYHTQINDALLTALVEAMGKLSGERRLVVEMEGHGREEIHDDLDLSRTVGWFTSVYPVVLDLEGVDTPGAALQQVKEQLRRIPGKGIGYGVLRYLSNKLEIRELLKADGRVELSFNYLGQLDQVLDAASLFGGAREYTGPQQSLHGRQRYALEVSVAVVQSKLRVRFTYNEKLHAAETIQGVIDEYMRALRELVAHCQSAEAGGFTPSDFPLIELNQSELDLALSEIDFS